MSSNTADSAYTDLLYHFTKNNKGVPVYPYVTAVTGHRSFAQSDQSEGSPFFSEQDIKEAFKSELRPMAELWRNSSNGCAPFILLTGLADGADQIAAEAALELDPELNIKVVAVLPMPEDAYIQTINNKTRFQNLLDAASYCLTLPLTPNNTGHESELTLQGDQAESRRQEQIAALSHFLAIHCHVLFAFWDGIPSTHLKGGTADTVFFKLNGSTDSQSNNEQNQGDLLTFSSVGPVVHLLIPRDNQDNYDYPLPPDLDMSSIPVFFLTRNLLHEKVYFGISSMIDNHKIDRSFLNSEFRCKTPVVNIPEIKEPLRKIGGLNTDSAEAFANHSFIDKCSQSYKDLFNISDNGQLDSSIDNNTNLFNHEIGNLNDFEDLDTRILAEHYAVADQMANYFHNKTWWILVYYSLIFFLFCLSSGILSTLWTIRIYGWATESGSAYHFIWTSDTDMSRYTLFCIPQYAAFYLIFTAALVWIYFYAKNRKYHYRYHRFRAIAEALRVQIFWRISGMKDCVSGYYRSHQIPETEWIRAAINGMNVFLSPSVDSGFIAPIQERIQLVNSVWIAGQRKYFVKKRIIKRKEQKRLHRITRWMSYILAFIFFCLPIKGDILKFLYSSKPSDEALNIFVFWGMIITLLTVVTVICTTHLKFKRSKSEAERFEQILFPFDRAYILLNSPRPLEEQQMILRQLGTEAISEHVSWLLTVGEQDLNLPR